MESSCGRGQGSLWTVAPTEEGEEEGMFIYFGIDRKKEIRLIYYPATVHE
jgi:hypothetical protein